MLSNLNPNTMKHIFFFFFIFLMSIVSKAQDKIIFEYDLAGNQVVRRFCTSCKFSNGDIKDIEEITEQDLIKSFPEDIISYYPNPVKDELYIKWEIINDNVVKEIQLFDVNGKLLSTINNLENTNNTNLQFSVLPANIYLLLLVYKNGEIKSIKIVKE